MDNAKKQIRNSSGSFICETFYEDGVWVVAIKKKNLYTYILLYDNGSTRIINVEEPLDDTTLLTYET